MTTPSRRRRGFDSPSEAVATHRSCGPRARTLPWTSLEAMGTRCEEGRLRKRALQEPNLVGPVIASGGSRQNRTLPGLVSRGAIAKLEKARKALLLRRPRPGPAPSPAMTQLAPFFCEQWRAAVGPLSLGCVAPRSPAEPSGAGLAAPAIGLRACADSARARGALCPARAAGPPLALRPSQAGIWSISGRE